MKKHECPENLEKLILCIPRVIFDGLSLEPDMDTFKEAMKSDKIELSEEELRERYKKFAREYGEDQRIAFMLSEYGENYEEIVKKLGEETEECLKCSDLYLAFLKQLAIKNIEISKHWDPRVAKLGEEYAEKGLLKSILEIDKKYLNIFGRTSNQVQ